MAAMVNMNSLLSGKDSRWLQLEVCREFQRNKCSRQDTECKFAHPPANVEVQNGKVTACYDSIKGRCNRDKPPCKYFHPPQHLKDQLLINGRNHLALKNALIQQMGGMAPGQPVIPGQVQTVATNPYLTGIPTNTYSPFYAPGHLVPALLGPDPSAVASQLGQVVPQAVQVAQQKIPRSDRLEAFSGVVPYKRPAAEKSGIPVYQPGATTYQQLMQLQQPFVPVSSAYANANNNTTTTSITTTTTTNNNNNNNGNENENNNNLAYANQNLNAKLNDSATTATTMTTTATATTNASEIGIGMGNEHEHDNDNNTNEGDEVNDERENSNQLNNINNIINNHNINNDNNDNNNNNNNYNDNCAINGDSDESQTQQQQQIHTNNAIINNNNNHHQKHDLDANDDVLRTHAAVASTTNNTSNNHHHLNHNNNNNGEIESKLLTASTFTTQHHHHEIDNDESKLISHSPYKMRKISYSNGLDHTHPHHQHQHQQQHHHSGVGILPTPPLPPSAAPSSQTTVTSSVITNPYQAQQNMQRLYNAYGAALASQNYAAQINAYVAASSAALNSQALVSTPTYSYANLATSSAAPTFAYATPQSTVTPSHTTMNYYATDAAAALAKEVAQKNYANAVKMASGGGGISALAGKPLTASAYTGMTLNKAFMPLTAAAAQQQQHTAQPTATQQQLTMAAAAAQQQAAFLQAHQQAQAQQQYAAAAAAQQQAAALAQMRSYSSLPSSGMATPQLASTPVPTPTHTPATATLLQRPGTGTPSYMPTSAAASTQAMLRPQAMQLTAAATNPYAALMQQQQQQQAGFFYPGMLPTATAAQTAGYPAYAAMAAPYPGMAVAPTAAAQSAAATAGSAMVLNPFKKMKTS